ncbi:hypothetical protein HQ531_12165 [bacterium]|nr:hypothetical protein [bacterium]
MIDNNISCPLCGSNDGTTTKEETTLEIPFSSSPVVVQEVYSCNECEYRKNLNPNDEAVAETKLAAEKESVIEMIENLSSLGFKQSYIEHVLQLPPRTLTGWKGGSFSKAALSLMRAITVFPEILKVAQFHWSEQKIKEMKIKASFNTLSEMIPVFAEMDYIQPPTKTININIRTNSDDSQVEDVAVIAERTDEDPHQFLIASKELLNQENSDTVYN